MGEDRRAGRREEKGESVDSHSWETVVARGDCDLGGEAVGKMTKFGYVLAV